MKRSRRHYSLIRRIHSHSRAVTLRRGSFCFAHVPLCNSIIAVSYHFVVAVWRPKTAESGRVKYCGIIGVVLAVLFASIALSEDIKTIRGKVYKDATVTRVEADGIELKTKTGIFKVYFVELPQDVQERFHWAKPEAPRESFYRRWAAAAGDPAILAKMIAAGAVIIASVALVINYIRSRRQPTTRVTRASQRKAVRRAR